MIRAEYVRGKIEENRLVTQSHLVSANRGFDVGPEAENSAKVARTEVTAEFWAFEADRAALGGHQVRRPGFNAYVLSVQR